jgi:hypothetical protein
MLDEEPGNIPAIGALFFLFVLVCHCCFSSPRSLTGAR